jgi:HEAT repeat protein
MVTPDSHTLSADHAEEVRYRRVQDQGHVPLQQSREILFAALGDTSWRVRKQAVEVVLALQPAEEDVHQLIDLLRDEDNAGLRNATAELLARLGSRVVPVLLGYLHDSDHDLRKLVVDALGVLGGEDALQGLIQALSDPDSNVAAAAAEGLGVAGNARSVSELLHHLEQNQEVFFRFNVLAALGKIGVSGPLPRIIRQLAGQEILRRAIYECLGKIGGDLEAVELLLEGVLSLLPSVRQAAVVSLAKVLQQLGAAEQAAARERLRSLADQGLIEQLTTLFRSADPAMSNAVVAILRVMADPRGVRLLFCALTDERLAAEAQQGISALGNQAVMAAITFFSETDKPAERAAVCAFLGAQGDRQAVLTIRTGLHDRFPEVRAAAVSAAARLDDPELPLMVVGLLHDEDAAVRESALTALHRYAVNNRCLIVSVARLMADAEAPEQRKGAALLFATLHDDDQIACLMKDENATVREAAARAAGKLKPSKNCSHLIMALVDEEPDVRIAAAEALGDCGDMAAVAPLRLSLKDSDAWVQAAALRNLVQLAGEDALPDLLKFWEKGDEVVQLACLESLNQLGSDDGLKAVSRGLGQRDGEVLKGAIILLNRHDSSLLAPWMHHILCHPDWDVRITAVRACGAFIEEERTRLLQMALDREEHDLVRAEIRALLGMH